MGAATVPVARDPPAIECASQLHLTELRCLSRFETPRPNGARLLSVRAAGAWSNLLPPAQDFGKARLFRRRELRSVRAGGGRSAPLPARDEEQAEGPDQQDGGGPEPQQRGMRGE